MLANIGKQFKGLIFEDDGSETQAQTQGKATQVQHSTIGLGGRTSVAQVDGVNPEYVAAIKKATFSRSTALTSLMSAADKLAAIIPDPATRLKSAHAMTGEGRTVRQITEAVDIHLSDVDGEELRFKTMINKKIESEVGALETQSGTLDQRIGQSQADIQSMQTRIGQLTQEIGEMTTEKQAVVQSIQTKRSDLDQAAAQFQAAAAAVKAELNANKQAIVSTLV